MTHPEIDCLGCDRKIDGVVYFDPHRPRGYWHRFGREFPLCATCAEELGRERWTANQLKYPHYYEGEYKLPPERTCEGCGRPLAWVAWRPPGRIDVCSEECRRERYRHRRRVKHEPRACAWCGQTFMPTRSDHRTCTDRCRQRLSRQARGVTVPCERTSPNAMT